MNENFLGSFRRKPDQTFLNHEIIWPLRLCNRTQRTRIKQMSLSSAVGKHLFHSRQWLKLKFTNFIGNLSNLIINHLPEHLWANDFWQISCWYHGGKRRLVIFVIFTTSGTEWRFWHDLMSRRYPWTWQIEFLCFRLLVPPQQNVGCTGVCCCSQAVSQYLRRSNLDDFVAAASERRIHLEHVAEVKIARDSARN